MRCAITQAREEPCVWRRRTIAALRGRAVEVAVPVKVRNRGSTGRGSLAAERCTCISQAQVCGASRRSNADSRTALLRHDFIDESARRRRDQALAARAADKYEQRAHATRRTPVDEDGVRLIESQRGALEVVGCDRSETRSNEFSIGSSDAGLTGSIALLEHQALSAARRRGEYNGAAIASILRGGG